MQVKLDTLLYKTESRQAAKQSAFIKPETKNEEQIIAEPVQEEAVSLELSEDVEPVEEKTEEAQDAMKAWKEALDDLSRRREAKRLEQQRAEARESKINANVRSSSKSTDNSSMLNKRLVAAISQMEVHTVISEANKDIIQLRMAAAGRDGEDAKAIMAIVRRLEKIVTRGRRKVSDLNNEDGMKRQEVRARQKKQEKRAEEIKSELREQIRARKRRERKYLQEESDGRTGMAGEVSGAASGGESSGESGGGEGAVEGGGEE